MRAAPYLKLGGVEISNGNRVSRYVRTLGDNRINMTINCECPALPGDCALVLGGTAGTNASTPDKEALDITGDIAIVAYDVALDAWVGGAPQTLVAKWDGIGSYILRILDSGTISLLLANDAGSTFNVNRSFTDQPAPGELVNGIAVTWRQSDKRVQHFRLLNGVWVQQGADGTINIDSIRVTAADVSVGQRADNSHGAAGRIGKAAISATSDINDLTDPRTTPDFSAQAPGTTSFTDAQGNVWTLNGNAVIECPPIIECSEE